MQRNVLEYLEQTTAKYPDQPAFADEKRSFTFSEFSRYCYALGTALLDIVPSVNRPVAVLTRRSAWSPVGFFGAVARGCFYVPIDSSMPKSGMELVLKQISPAAILYEEINEKLANELSEYAPAVCIEKASQGAVDEARLAAERGKVLDIDPVYAIFTSGSTGVPKGIVQSHRALIDFTDWYEDITGITQEDRLGNQAPFFFDLSVKDVYTTLKTGAMTYVLPKKCFSFPMLLIKALNEQGITTLSWSTAAFNLIANSGILEKDPPKTVKRALLGGEALRAKQVNIWHKALPEAHFTNLYGPTEVTVDCTYYPIDREFSDEEPIPIGRNCENKEVLLLNEDNELAAVGEPGEICVRGSGVALGYFANPEKTAEVFVQNPLNPYYPDKLYRTGDIGQMNEAGEIFFLSRVDGQVKHMGYRIELGEIENALSAVPEVKVAVCLFDRPSDRIHCVYQGDIDSQDLARKLGEGSLPKYKLPNVYHRKDVMPQTANGKVDRVTLKKEFIETEKTE